MEAILGLREKLLEMFSVRSQTTVDSGVHGYDREGTIDAGYCLQWVDYQQERSRTVRVLLLPRPRARSALVTSSYLRMEKSY